MSIIGRSRRSSISVLKTFSATVVFILLSAMPALAQPANDNCANASVVTISSTGFGLGVFTSATFDLTSATVQGGETFAPAILVAGQNQKSVWYKFTLPTTRSVRVTLAQPGSSITAGDAGFAVYKTNTCLPTGADISTKITPIGLFGNSFHPCVESGEYLVQVSGKAAANGQVYITVETGQATAAFDLPVQAYNFGTLPRGASAQPDFTIDCQSIDDGNEICNTLYNYQDYNKSTWHVFKTPAYLDYLSVVLYTAPVVKVGYKIYKGDVRSTPYNSLPVVAGCDSFVTSVTASTSKIFGCNELDPNTTYSIQLFYNKDFYGLVALKLSLEGSAPTIAPEPLLSAITPTTNNMGVLASSPTGIGTATTDVFACNARHSLHPCEPSMPANGVIYNGKRYNLSSFFLFTLSGTSNISIGAQGAFGSPGGICGPPYYVRLYKQNVSNSCNSLDTANIIGSFITGGYFTCLPPGNYTLQVMGQDTTDYNYQFCQRSNLGSGINVNINVQSTVTSNKFSLSSPGAFDTLNNVGGVMQPLVPNITYVSKVDTFGCANTVVPNDICIPGYTKAIYREFIVPDSGIVSLRSSGSGNFAYRLYKGDANALAIAQNTFSYPGIINGLVPQTQCLGNTGSPPNVCDDTKVCVEPGTYTEVVVGAHSINQIGQTNQFQVRFNIVNTVHYSLATAEDMGDVLSIIPSTGGSITSAADYYSCKDNAMIIDGSAPCPGGYGSPGTKAIYRQFYLSSAAIIGINSIPVGCDYTPFTLFKGKATDGVAALTVMPAPWRCAISVNGGVCASLAAGWYTVVSYGWGPSYQNPMRNLNDVYYNFPEDSSTVGFGNKITITMSVPTCPLPKYNRPNKAAIDTSTNQPFLIQWVNRVGSTTAYPRTDTTYNLYTENFLCPDTPFASHPVLPCNTDPSFTRVAYYVFQVTQECFLRINTNDPWLSSGYGARASVYAGNVRTIPNLLINNSPIQPCIVPATGQLQLCNVQPGYYTLVVYAHNDMACRSVTPSIYIDKMGYSRFDHANNAYDFGLIPSDSVWHNGKPGDVNPLDPGRAPSNDFFYCTTGSRPDDPAYYCNNGNTYIPQLYTPGVNYPIFPSNWYYGTFGNLPRVARQNLWYTFTVDKGGWVRVRVNNKTTGKTFQYPFNVMKSDVNGSSPFSTVVSSGAVDSTAAQGLTGIANNAHGFTCIGGPEVAFFRETCSPIPERYYIIIQNDIEGAMLPNHQVEVSILFDSVNAIQPKFDHYYQANNIGTNLGPGTYNGEQDNISCATRDATDPHWPIVSCGDKTIWYKFSTTVSGVIKMRMFNTTVNYFDAGIGRIQLFRQIIPGDSTSNGLQYIGTSFVNYGGGVFYSEACISPGTYYIILPNCFIGSGYVYPQFILEENAGDYCTRPVIATLNGAGTSVTSALVNCHTIGTDYGEFNPTLTCPAGAVTTQYKTSWFKINITGTDTLDVTTYLTESTNASSSQIKYRLMNGNCGAMQERSCVQDALTQDTYKCLAPGEYWVQVFTPVSVSGNQTIGTIELHLSAINHVDTCAPINPCLSNANFQMQFDCTQSAAVRFINYSTFGSSVSYQWDFGYNGQTSTVPSPQFVYPSLTTSQKYYITLSVNNNTCGGISTYMDSITIPARPIVNLGADTSLCSGGSVVLTATSHPGSTYLWSTGSTTATITANTPGIRTYTVAVTYNGCIARDTVSVNIDPITPQTVTKYLCGINSTVLNAARGLGESYLWSTGANSSSISVFNAGTYWCDLFLNGCTTRDTFIVSATASSLGNDRSVCFGTQPVVLNATTTGASGYTWQNGSTAATFTAPAAGLYWVDISFGNCTLRDTIVLSNIQAQTASMGANICQGLTYTLPSGIIVSNPGIYKDTLRTTGGCDSIINTVTLSVQSVNTLNSNAAICPGQTYTLPWGTIVSLAGIYRDTLRYFGSGCDSIRRNVTLAIQSANSTTTNATICESQTYTLPWGTVANAAGVYRDTLRYVVTNCDSVRRTVNLTVQSATTTNINATICSGQTYTLPWGAVVNAAGVYRDTLRYAITNCDSVRRTVNLSVQSPVSSTSSATICSGQIYTLPWGAIVNASGIYRDTLSYAVTSCDSFYNIVNLTVLSSAQTTSSSAVICTGQTYTLPWGTIVSAAGVYIDTLHFTNGCDSLYRIINLTIQSPSSSSLNPIICAGQTYTLPWGTVANTSGTYRDTLHYVNTGCDSLYRTIVLTVQSFSSTTLSPVICAGQTYTLPSGVIVSSNGIYSDTLRYVNTNCDSLYRIINLTVLPSALVFNTNAAICTGQTYTLPWGSIVSTAGIYRDTVRFANGCDSLYRTINLTVQSPTSLSVSPILCSGLSYTLPWGTVVNTSGIYRDTLHYVNTGCDSLYRTISLTVQSLSTITLSPAICAGQTYTLPWGPIVNSSGIYRDTLRYTNTGCDSLYRIVDLIVLSSPLISNINAAICLGQTYTLPSGAVVGTAGIYRDTVRTAFGCDSLYRTIDLSVQSPSSLSLSPTICSNQTYTLPWGTIVNASGIYRDTLHYINTGCDSLYRTVTLTIQSLSTTTLSAVICAGQTYTLPWGTVVNSSGTYRDTLRYANTGCDSIKRIVTLTVQNFQSVATNPIICSGQSFTLPWGTVVNTSGTYRDTLHYTSTGCDSVRRTVNLTVQTSQTTTLNPIICQAQTYTLPWGTIVNTSGIYRDTLHYTNTGCDSVRRTVNLTVQNSVTASNNITICQGQSYTLPWGAVVNASGIYRDTLRYRITNCDSVYRIVNLSVTPAALSSINASICAGDFYTLPWGTNVTTAGVYRDTVRTSFGCDSLIRNVTITVRPKPTVSISKSNDIDCMIGTSKLNATGGVSYLWQPGSSLSNPTASNPIATPTATTVYKVQVTSANGCIKQDSIEVKVIPGVVDNGFLLPSAFTPNGDGKNDCFGLRTWGNVTNVRFEIYNRWGELVFRTADPSQCWDGTYKGERQSTAVFIYQAWADTFCGPVYRKGTVTLVR